MDQKTAKASAIVHSNIALVKYWGRSSKFPAELNMPLNDTVSMTKRGISDDSTLSTHTTIEFSPHLDYDEVQINDNPADDRTTERIKFIINALKKNAGMAIAAEIIDIPIFIPIYESPVIITKGVR